MLFQQQVLSHNYNFFIKNKNAKYTNGSTTTKTDCLFVKLIHSEKATQFYEIFTLLLSYVVPVRSKVKISQNFVAFSEYMNFIINGQKCPPHKLVLTIFFIPAALEIYEGWMKMEESKEDNSSAPPKKFPYYCSCNSWVWSVQGKNESQWCWYVDERGKISLGFW